MDYLNESLSSKGPPEPGVALFSLFYEIVSEITVHLTEPSDKPGSKQDPEYLIIYIHMQMCV